MAGSSGSSGSRDSRDSRDPAGASGEGFDAARTSSPALAVRAVDIPGIARRLGLSERSLLTSLLRADPEDDARLRGATAVVPLVRDDARRVDVLPDATEETGGEASEPTRLDEDANADAVGALFAARGAASEPESERAPLLLATTGRRPARVRGGRRPEDARRRAEDEREPGPEREPERDASASASPSASIAPLPASPPLPLGYLVGIPASSPLVPGDAPGAARGPTPAPPSATASIARLVRDAGDGAVNEFSAALAAAAAAAAAADAFARDAAGAGSLLEEPPSDSNDAAAIAGDGSASASSAAASFASTARSDASLPRDEEVVVRRVIFAVPGRAANGVGGAGANAPPGVGETRRALAYGGSATDLSLPSAVREVTLEMRGGGDGVAARELRDFEREALGERSSPPASSPRRRRFRLFRPGSSLTVPLIERRRDASSGILRPDDGGGGASGGFTSSAASLAGAKMSDLRASVTVTRRVPWIGWVILSSAVVSLSCVGALVVRQRSMPFAQCAWRAESCVALVAPWAAWTWKTQGARGLRDASVRRTAVVVALCWSGWFVTMFWGLDHTSIPHVYMLTNTTSAIIVAREAAASRFRGVPAAHAVGVALAAAGAALVMWDSDRGHHPGASSAGSPPPSSDGSDDMHLRPPSGRREATLRGDAVVLAGAFAGAGFLVLAKRVRDAVELSHLLLIQMAINLPIVVALAAAFENPNGAFFLRPLDPAGGVFGWLTREQIAPQTFIAVFGTVVGTAGYVASLKYLAATVVAIAMLMEPVLATAVGWLAGANAFPRPVTLAGMALVTAGTFAVVVDAGRKKRTEEAVDATDATSGREEAEVGGGREREGTPSE